jgi:hypothetical protein
MEDEFFYSLPIVTVLQFGVVSVGWGLIDERNAGFLLNGLDDVIKYVLVDGTYGGNGTNNII